MRSISDSAIRNLLIAALIIMIIILGLFSVSVFATDGSVIIGGRIANVIPSPTIVFPTTCLPPHYLPTPAPFDWIPVCPQIPPGDLPLRSIDGMYMSNTLADVIPFSPVKSMKYVFLLIPPGSTRCSNPRPGAFFLGKGTPVGPGQNALLMTVIGCSR